MRALLALLLIAVTLPSTSCTAGTTSGSPGRSSDLISDEELEEARQRGENLYQAIQRLRPTWLVARGVTMRERIEPVVYLNGSPYGELDFLRQISVSDVREVRRINAADATTRYGTGHAGGVIAVTTGR